MRVALSVIQTLPSTFMLVGVTMLVCVVRSSHSLLQRIGRDLLGLAVDLGRAALVRHADPEIAVRIELEIERALRLLRPQQIELVSPTTLPVFGSSSPTIWLPKSVYQACPSASITTSCGMRFFARQVVFGDDDLGGLALRARQGLEVVFEPVRVGEADVLQEFGRLLASWRRATRGRSLRAPPCTMSCGCGGVRLGRVAAHAREHLLPFFGVMQRREHALQACGSPGSRAGTTP